MTLMKTNVEKIFEQYLFIGNLLQVQHTQLSYQKPHSADANIL